MNAGDFEESLDFAIGFDLSHEPSHKFAPDIAGYAGTLRDASIGKSLAV